MKKACTLRKKVFIFENTRLRVDGASNTLFKVDTFENGDSSYSCGRAKTEVFKYALQLGWRILKTEMYRIRVDGRKQRFSNTMMSCLPFRTYDSKTLRVDAGFFKYRKKKLRFRKYPATCGWSNTIQKRYVWTKIFLNTEEKSPFSKIPGYLWRRPEMYMYTKTCRNQLRHRALEE